MIHPSALAEVPRRPAPPRPAHRRRRLARAAAVHVERHREPPPVVPLPPRHVSRPLDLSPPSPRRLALFARPHAELSRPYLVLVPGSDRHGRRRRRDRARLAPAAAPLLAAPARRRGGCAAQEAPRDDRKGPRAPARGQGRRRQARGVGGRRQPGAEPEPYQGRVWARRARPEGEEVSVCVCVRAYRGRGFLPSSFSERLVRRPLSSVLLLP